MFSVIELLGILARQDPYEMIWVESQEAAFLVVVVGLLTLWVSRGLLRLRARRAEKETMERLIRRGMMFVFEQPGS